MTVGLEQDGKLVFGDDFAEVICVFNIGVIFGCGWAVDVK